MGRAKDIEVHPIAPADARRIIKRLHYSGKVTNNSQVHFGVFLDGKCGGALQFGPSLDKRKLVGLVADTKWNGFIELNRLALAEWLPRNSESRALAVAMRLLRRAYPWLQWVVSFADATQSGDGTIYRAAGFVLTGIKVNKQMLRWGDRIIARKTLDNPNYPKVAGEYYSRTLVESGQAQALPGFQLRYIYFLDPAARERLTVPIIPFAEIARRGASMYRGIPGVGSIENDAPAHPGRNEGGGIPTPTLQTVNG